MADRWSLCLALLIFSVNFTNWIVHGQPDDSNCPGGRISVTGECYGHGGDPCSDVISCDTDLGYTCRPTENNVTRCFGRRNLRTTDVGQTFFSIAWDNFMSHDYQYEYSARMTEKYNTELSTWRVQEIGRQPSYNFTYLTPGTVYFVLIGVWKDANFSSYSNYTEVLIVRTLDVSECHLQTRTLKVGETVQNGCLSRCICLATGSVRCEPVCNNTNWTGTGSDGNCVEVKTKDSCCTFLRCLTEEKSPEEFVKIIVLDVKTTSVSIKIQYFEKHLRSTLYFCVSQSGLYNSTHKTQLQWNNTMLEVRQLKQSYTYEVWMEYSINNVLEVVSPKTQFTTQQMETTEPNKSTAFGKIISRPKSKSNKSSVYLVIILATTVVLVLLVLVFIYVWRRRKRKSRQSLSFENKTFGLNLSFRKDAE